MVHPIITSSLLALGIDCCSNVIAQRMRAWSQEKPFVFDSVLFTQFAIMVCIMAPVNYCWQQWLERTFPGWKTVIKRKDKDIELGNRTHDVGSEDTFESVGKDFPFSPEEEHVRVRNWFNIFRKWFTDCITGGAIINTVAFLVIMGVLKGKPATQIGADLKNETLGIIWDSYKVWPIANFFSTTYCPVERRIVFLSCCGLIWNIYMSLVAARL